MIFVITALHHHVEQQARTRPEAAALTSSDTTLTYAQLWRAVRQAGVQLAGLGVERHDRVAVYLEKRVETVAALWGTSLVGGVFVPVNPLLKGKQVAHVVRDSGARILVTSPGRLAAVRDQLDGAGLTAVLLVDQPDGGTAPEGLPGVTVHRWAPSPGTEEDVTTLPQDSGPGPTPTSRRSCTRPAARAPPRASSCRTATCSSARPASPATCTTPPKTCSSRCCP